MASVFLHETKMGVDCFLGMMVFLGGGYLGILEEGIEP
jgi:hypothetical protein